MQATRAQTSGRAHGRDLVAAGRQSTFCVAIFFLACVAAAVLWWTSPPRVDYPLGVALLAGSVPLAAHVSLRVRAGARLYFTGASILFIVTLLSPALAIAVMGIGMGAKELTVCRRCQNMPWQVVGQAGRWMLIAACASFLVHLTNVLAASAVIGVFLWTSDVLTAPLVLRTQSSLRALYRNLIARSWSDELMQYMTGTLLVPVVLLERQQPFVILSSAGVLALWLLMFYMMHDGSERHSA